MPNYETTATLFSRGINTFKLYDASRKRGKGKAKRLYTLLSLNECADYFLECFPYKINDNYDLNCVQSPCHMFRHFMHKSDNKISTHINESKLISKKYKISQNCFRSHAGIVFFNIYL